MQPAYFNWQTPSELTARVEEDRERLGEEWKRRAGREFREAFIAARFAESMKATAVRLLAPDGSAPTPDFAIRLNDKECWYETTELDRPGRKRGSEPPLEGLRHVTPDEWVATSEYLDVLRERSSSKVSKCYRKCEGVVIYDNAWPLRDPENQTADWWRSGTVEARARFAEVWSFDGKTFALIT